MGPYTPLTCFRLPGLSKRNSASVCLSFVKTMLLWDISFHFIIFTLLSRVTLSSVFILLYLPLPSGLPWVVREHSPLLGKLPSAQLQNNVAGCYGYHTQKIWGNFEEIVKALKEFLKETPEFTEILGILWKCVDYVRESTKIFEEWSWWSLMKIQTEFLH